MRFKFLNAAFVGLILPLFCIVNIAKAGLIETDFEELNDNLAVYDTVTELTWLDLSVTDGLSYNAAGAAYSMYRYATETEVVDLFSSFFSGINFSTTFGATLTNNSKTIEFRRLFGETLPAHSFGMFLNDNGRIDSLGTFGQKVAHNPNFVLDDPDASKHWHGVFMVRIPEPSTVVIFAIGLIGLASRLLKKA
jgi:hypothetical protein